MRLDCRADNNHILGCITAVWAAEKGRGSVPLLLSGEIPPAVLQLWGLQHRKDMGLLQRIQSMATKTLRGMEHFFRERLKEFGIVQPGKKKKRLWGDPGVAFQYLKRSLQEMERFLPRPRVTGQEGMASN